ncbi:MAG: DUF1934 domain-containing protein [Aerococcus sp.]|nr:DUF1934 domain-containing protein [Aerococcus sp.]
MSRHIMKPQPITIHGHNEMVQAGETEQVNFEVAGKYYQMRQALYLEYQEENAGQTVDVRIKIIPGDGMVIRRSSKELVSQLPLLTKSENRVHYTLAEGYQIELYAEVAQFKHEEQKPGSGRIICNYTLNHANGAELGKYGLELKYRS